MSSPPEYARTIFLYPSSSVFIRVPEQVPNLFHCRALRFRVAHGDEDRVFAGDRADDFRNGSGVDLNRDRRRESREQCARLPNCRPPGLNSAGRARTRRSFAAACNDRDV